MAEHARFGGVVPEVASRAHLEAMVPTVHRALADAGVAAADVDAVAVTAGPGPDRRAAGRRRRRQGLRARAGQAALRRQPPGRARRRRRARSTGRWPSPASRCWSPAGTARCCSCPTSPARSSAGPHHRRRRGGGLRQGRPACSGCRSPAARRSTGRPATATRRRSPSRAGSPARATPPSTSPSPGLKTAVARWVEARERAGEPVPVADVAASLPGGRRRRAHREGGRGPAASTASTTWCSAAGSRPTPGCARWPRSAARRPASSCACRSPRLCTDNGAMVAALGSRLVAAGVAPSAADLGADSSLPIDVVTR